jgi:hypothetical protein
MAWPGDIQSIHNPATNTSPPASWGDAIRDALQFLAGTDAAQVDTEQTTTSTTYADLTTAGPAVTITTGTRAIVRISALMYQTTGGTGFVSVAVSGATTVAANDTDALTYASTTFGSSMSRDILIDGLTPGSNTFTMKYRTTANTLNAGRRTISVTPLTA